MVLPKFFNRCQNFLPGISTDYGFPQLLSEINTKEEVLQSLAALEVDLPNTSSRDHKKFRNSITPIKNSRRVQFFDPSYDVGELSGFLLYVLIRCTAPQFVLETGVAAGFSSSTILSVLDSNDSGTLKSIDITNQVGERISKYVKSLWTLGILKKRNPGSSF